MIYRGSSYPTVLTNLEPPLQMRFAGAADQPPLQMRFVGAAGQLPYKSAICSDPSVGAAGETAPTNAHEPPLQMKL